MPPTATPTPVPTPTPTSIILVPELAVRCADLPLSGQIQVALGQLDSGTQNLSRDNPQAHYTLDIPGNFSLAPTGNTINLVTSHFPRVPDKPSALKIEVNERLVFAIVLTRENAPQSQTRIDLPPDVLRPGSNSIVVRLETGATCDDPGAILNVVIDESSTVDFGYQQDSYPASLSYYPLPFAEKSLCSIPVTMILPDQPTADHLAAAVTIAAGLGQQTEGEIVLHAISAGSFDPSTHSNHHLIAIGQLDSNTFLQELEPPPAVARANLKAEQGFLEVQVSPWSKYRQLLIVSGLDDQGILKASQVLPLEDRPSSIRGSSAKVDSVPPPAIEPGSLPPEQMTLASLGQEDETIYGAQLQNLGFDFTLPPGWQLTGPAAFKLVFSHATILDPQKSVIDIRLNDRPVDSTFLDDSTAAEGELTVRLPQRVLQTGNNHLEIGIEMNLAGADGADRCRLLDDKRLWTVISGDSVISVPYTIAHFRPDLGHLPYPFAQDSGIAQTLFVMPDQSSENMIDDLIQLGARLGTFSQTDYLVSNVAYASEATQDTWQDHHLFLLGRPTENALLSEFNEVLPLPFEAGSDTPAPVDDAAPQVGPGRQVGLLQIANSPWNENLALLAVTGTSKEGTRMAVQAVLEPQHDLKGNLAIINSVDEQTSQISVRSVDTRPPDSVDRPDRPGESDSQGESPAQEAAVKRDLTPLANRWWK
jgi:hypothetical protein